MRKRLLVLFVCISLLLSVVGCQGSKPSEKPAENKQTEAPKEEPQKEKHLAVASFNSGTFQYMYIAAVSGLTRPILKNLILSNEATSGTTENLDLLRRGEVAIGLSSPERLYYAYKGIDKYEGKKTDVGILWGYTQQAATLFAKESSGIKGFQDLKGKKVCIGPAGSANEIKNSFILDAYGYTRVEKDKFKFNELDTVSLAYAEAANALAEGVVDAVIATQPLPDPSFYELALRVPLTIAPVDKEMHEKVLSVYPWMWSTKIPADIYPNQKEALDTLGDPNYVVGHLTELSEEDAYNLTKVYVEQVLPQIAEQFDSLKPYVKDPQLLASSWVIPGHPGAVKYYKEKGINIEVVKE